MYDALPRLKQLEQSRSWIKLVTSIWVVGVLLITLKEVT